MHPKKDKNAILIIDGKEDFLLQNMDQLKKQLASTISEIVVSPYNYVSEDLLFELAGKNVKIMSYDEKGKIAKEARECYSKKVSSLANDWKIKALSIEEFLNYDNDFPAWWFTSITVKNETQKLGQYYFWKTFFEKYKDKENSKKHFIILSYDELCKQVSEEVGIKHVTFLHVRIKNTHLRKRLSSLFEPGATPSFTSSISIVSHLFWEIFTDIHRFIKTSFLKNVVKRERPDKKKKHIAFISVYPLWWNKITTSQSHDRYYTDLPNKLNSEGFEVVLLTFLPQLSNKGIKLFNQETFYRKCYPFFLFESFKELLSTIRFRFWLLFKLNTILSSSKMEFYGPLERELYTKELIYSLLGDTPHRYAFFMAFTALLNKINIEKIIMYDEFYGFGRAIVVAVNSVDKNIKTYGYQHGIIPIGRMSYYYEKIDAKKMPLPNHFLIWGKQSLDVLRANEIFAENFCKIMGGYRFKPQYIPVKTGPHKKDIILVVTSVYDSFTLPNFIIRHIDKFPLKIIIKPHPTKGGEVQSIVENAAQKKKFGQKIEVVDRKRDPKTLLGNTKFLITTRSTVGIEAVCMHIPIIALPFLDFPGISQYEGIKNDWLMSASSEKEFLNELELFLNKNRIEENAESLIRYFIDDYENSLYKLIEILKEDR